MLAKRVSGGLGFLAEHKHIVFRWNPQLWRSHLCWTSTTELRRKLALAGDTNNEIRTWSDEDEALRLIHTLCTWVSGSQRNVMMRWLNREQQCGEMMALKVFGQHSGLAVQRSGTHLWLVLIFGWMCWQERTHKARPLFSFKTGWRPRACAAGPHQLYHAATPDKTRQSDPKPCTVSLSHTCTPTHTGTDTDTHGLQYVKCEHDGNGFCLTPDCFVTDKCVTRAKGRTLSSRQNAELLRQIQNRRVQINQLLTQTALTKTPGGGARAVRQTLCWQYGRWSLVTYCQTIKCRYQSAEPFTAHLHTLYSLRGTWAVLLFFRLK